MTKRVRQAPKFVISYETGLIFKALSPESKDKVFRAFYKWLQLARKRNADLTNTELDDDGLTDIEQECLRSFVDNATDGLESYWSRCHKEDEKNVLDSQSIKHERTVGIEAKQVIIKELRHRRKKI